MQWLIFEDFGCGFFSILDGLLKAAFPPQLFMLNTEGRLTSGEWCLKAERVDHITIAWCEMGKVPQNLYLVSFGNKLWFFQMDGPWSYDDSKQQIVHKKLGRSGHFEMATFMCLDQYWSLQFAWSKFFKIISGKCLALHADSSALVMRECDDHNSYHKWVAVFIQHLNLKLFIAL